MQYELKLMNTQAGIGCFKALPKANLSLTQMLEHLRTSPLDNFMHQLVLERLGQVPNRKIAKMVKEILKAPQKDPVLAALLYEACLVHSRLASFTQHISTLNIVDLLPYTPNIELRSHQLPDQKLHQSWSRLFAANIVSQQTLPGFEKINLKKPQGFSSQSCVAKVHIQSILKTLTPTLPPAKPRQPLEKTLAQACGALEKVNIPLTPEGAHRASLAPFGFLRHWTASMTVSLGRNKHTFQGMQTSYGRGMNILEARTSLHMEMIERASAYASINSNGVQNRAKSTSLFYGNMIQAEQKIPCLPLHKLRLEVPYQEQKIFWMQGHRPTTTHSIEQIYLPIQLVFLFCNLDEISLFSAPGSTGLAAGNTLNEAKVSALCEVLERDALAVQAFDLDTCFRIKTEDKHCNTLLEAYERCGINVWFQDISNEFGIPCYRSFVVGREGDIHSASGCGLCAKRALLSAMTETPFPFNGISPSLESKAPSQLHNFQIKNYSMALLTLLETMQKLQIYV